MNVQELVEIIKREKLYEYEPFRIGLPNDPNRIGVVTGTSDTEGIFYDKEAEIWRIYFEDERGGIQLATSKCTTEDEVCRRLLETIRLDKALAIKYGWGKIHGIIINKEKWWSEMENWSKIKKIWWRFKQRR